MRIAARTRTLTVLLLAGTACLPVIAQQTRPTDLAPGRTGQLLRGDDELVGQDRPDEPVALLRAALEQLERAIGALESAGVDDHRQDMRRLAVTLRERLAGDDRTDRAPRRRRQASTAPERRDRIERQLAALRLAMPALREGERREALEILERAIHARELALAGEQVDFRPTPGRGQLLRCFREAYDVLIELGDPDRAAELGRLVAELWPQGDEAAARTPARERAARDVETMELALHALLEANRMEEADALRRAIMAKQRSAAGGGQDGRRGRTRRGQIDAPSPAEQRELLTMAADVWRELDRPEAAERIDALAGSMAAGRRPPRAQGDRDDPVGRMERRLDELQEMIEAMRRELAALRGPR